jgi:hypothetical protein
LFYDTMEGGQSDGLIEFHNKMNQNLFQKKNLKILKRFYEQTEDERRANTHRHKKNIFLTDGKIDYILQQRAEAIKSLNSAVGHIQKEIPLSKRIVLDSKPEERKKEFKITKSQTVTDFSKKHVMNSTLSNINKTTEKSRVQTSSINKSNLPVSLIRKENTRPTNLTFNVVMGNKEAEPDAIGGREHRFADNELGHKGSGW